MKTSCKKCGMETPTTHRDICGVCETLINQSQNGLKKMKEVETIDREFNVTTYEECSEPISGYKLNDGLNILRETTNELIRTVNYLLKKL